MGPAMDSVTGAFLCLKTALSPGNGYLSVAAGLAARCDRFATVGQTCCVYTPLACQPGPVTGQA